jgi:hypothetical protein
MTNSEHVQALYGNQDYVEDRNDSRFEPEVVGQDFGLDDLPYADEMYLVSHDLV